MSDLQNAYTYHVDIVLVFDGTGSMGPYIDVTKTRASEIHRHVEDALTKVGKHVNRLRVRPIVFRDLFVEGPDAIQAGEFFSLPEQEKRFKEFLAPISAHGGGDEPESALEALYLAMASPWTNEGVKNRHLIVLFTDASAHPLERAASLASRPSGAPTSLVDLAAKWEQLDDSAKRLVLFAPDATPWSEIGNTWDGIIWYPSSAGAGISEYDYGAILEIIARSVGSQ